MYPTTSYVDCELADSWLVIATLYVLGEREREREKILDRAIKL